MHASEPVPCVTSFNAVVGFLYSPRASRGPGGGSFLALRYTIQPTLNVVVVVVVVETQFLLFDTSTAAKDFTHLPLSRMNVDVHMRSRHLYGEIDERVGVLGQDVLVGGFYCLLYRRALHQSVVDEEYKF